MTRERPVVIAGLLLFIVGVGATAGRSWPEHSPQTPTACESVAAIDDLRGEVERLREELARTKARAAVLVVALATAQTREPPEPPHLPVVPKTAVAETVDISSEDLLQRTEELFRSEGRDPLWSAPAEIVARRQLSSVMGDRGQMQLECHASICRAEVTYPNSAQYDLVAGTISTESYEWRGGRTTSLPSRTIDGKVIVVHYLFKEGEDPQREIYAEEEARLATSHRQ